MEREANYAAVGAFVLLVLAMGALFVYWYAGGTDARDYRRYEIYFDGSVSGLARGSTVRYLGVDIGRVVDLRIDKRAAARVQVIADIDTDAPVTDSTVAELSLQGVTGLLYIDLVERRPGMRVATTAPSERYPVIPSVRSSFDVFLASLPELVAAANKIAARVNTILDDDNVAAIRATLANLDAASRHLPGTLREAEKLVGDLRRAAREVEQVAAGLRIITDDAGPDLKAALGHVRVVADNLAGTTAKLDRLIEENRQDVRAFARDGLPQFERLLRDARAAAQEFAALARSLRDNPSQILDEPSARGVEIPR
ncbi:MAG: MlaD family protein [Steroidobacteraceae bacterium]|nr:MlaD family protein [Steroidobacteraceae bacterium]MDW8259445.1 MlaD family protein [Gammaproteobacteria bacterium]